MKHLVIVSMSLALLSTACGSKQSSNTMSETPTEASAPSAATVDLSSFPKFDDEIYIPIGNHGSTVMEMLGETKFGTASGYYDYRRYTLDLTTGTITEDYDDTYDPRDTTVVHLPKTAEWFSALKSMTSHVSGIVSGNKENTHAAAVKTYLDALFLSSFPKFEGTYGAPVGNHGSQYVKMIDQTKLMTVSGYGPDSREYVLDLNTAKITYTIVELGNPNPKSSEVSEPNTAEWQASLDEMLYIVKGIEAHSPDRSEVVAVRRYLEAASN